MALTIRSGHGLMLLAELLSVVVYILSLLVLKDYFGMYRNPTQDGSSSLEKVILGVAIAIIVAFALPFHFTV